MKLWRYLKIFLALGVVLCTLVIFGCDDEETVQKTQANFADVYNPDDTWLVYWYVCGSDLESEGGAASGSNLSQNPANRGER